MFIDTLVYNTILNHEESKINNVNSHCKVSLRVNAKIVAHGFCSIRVGYILPGFNYD